MTSVTWNIECALALNKIFPGIAHKEILCLPKLK